MKTQTISTSALNVRAAGGPTGPTARSAAFAVLATLLTLFAGAQASAQQDASAPPARQDAPPARQDAAAPSGIFTEHVTVRVLNVDVIVTDRSGQPVAGLGREDFELRVDGKPVSITNFYSEAGEVESATGRPAIPEPRRDPSFRSLEEIRTVPRRSHVVILIDHTRLRSSNRKRAFKALRQAVDRLGDDDLVAVVGVEGSLKFYSDFLFDRQGVHQILDDVSRVSFKTDVNVTERRRIYGELTRGMSGGIQARASLADSNALIARIRSYAAEEYARGINSLRQIEAVASTMSGVPGRKTLMYLGEGIPTRPGEGMWVEYRNRFSGAERGLPHQNFNTDYTREVGRFDLTTQMDQLAKATNRAGVTLYAVDAESSHSQDIRGLSEQGAFSEALSTIDENYRAPLEYTTKATGGRLLRSAGTLADQLVELVGGLRTFYSLGFAPPDGWQAGSDHDIEVKVQGKGLVVNHREQVRLPEADEREAGATVAALMYQTVDNPLEIVAKPGFEVPREDGETAALPVNLEIPIGKLGFLPQADGTQACSLTIYVSIRNREGDPGKIQKIPFHLAIPDDKMEQALADSAHYPLPLVLRRGDRQVAIGIRDNVNRQFSAIRLDVAQYSQF